MALRKIENNKIGLDYKTIFNGNVDELLLRFQNLNRENIVLNSRISNLVLQSGGDSPNEVVDARVDAEGVAHATLYDRLLATDTSTAEELLEIMQTLSNQAEEIERLNRLISAVYGGVGSTVDIFVSDTMGDDNTADGTEDLPFKTIQAAVNSIALIASSVITIWIDDGVYLEDVMMVNVKGTQVIVRGMQDSTLYDPATQDLPVKIRSLGFYYCQGYIRVEGIQFVDQNNTMIFENQPYSILCEQGGYVSVTRCKFAEDTKQKTTHRSTYCGGSSKMTINRCHFLNQNTVNSTKLLAETRINSDLTGSGNNIGYRAEAATIRLSPNNLIATTETQTPNQGMILKTGVVM